MARNSYHFAQFFTEFDLGPPKVSSNGSAARALLWGHCHQRATGGVDADQQVLQKMGIDVQPVSGGCCGLAGSWGFEQGKYQLSLDCGEQALLPTIRQNSDALVVANGFSCQTQIRDSGTANALHLGQIMAMANTSADIGSTSPPARPSPTHERAPPGSPCRWPRRVRPRWPVRPWRDSSDDAGREGRLGTGTGA